MRRTARVTIATGIAAAVLAAPGAAPAAGPLDEIAGQLGCTGGHDGPRCTNTGTRAKRAMKKNRVCLPGGGLDYQGCLTRGHRAPLPGR